MRGGLIALALFFFSGHAWSDWRPALPDAQLCGQGEFRMIGFDIYTAQLWGSCDSAPFDAPFALQLTYHRTIARSKIVDSSLDEMMRLAARPVSSVTLAHWRDLMQTAFVDVKSGDTLIGVYLPGEGVRFYAGTRLTADIDDVQFARAFFEIWLHAETRAPGLRNDLLKARP
jgi:hypothetical protein